VKLPRRTRNGQLPIPITIGIVLAVVIVGIMMFNWFFYGRTVDILQRRLVLADVEEFKQFAAQISDSPSSAEEIITLRDDPDGNYLLLQIQLLLKHVYAKKGTKNGQINLRGDDFALVSGNETWNPVLLTGGYLDRGKDGNQVLVMLSLTLRRGANGMIELGEAGSDSEDEQPNMGDLVRGVKKLHGAASFGGSGARREVLDWVRAPIGERSKIIQPPGLSGYVYRAVRTQDKQEAWRAVDATCLFPLPPPGTNAKLVVFGDSNTAVPVAIP
jgi:hypothetical protein